MTGGLPEALIAFAQDPAGSIVITDVDGTIAPIAADPSLAGVPQETLDALALLSRKFLGIGVLSGRALDDLTRMIGLGGIYYVGNHGVEIQNDGGRSIDPEVLEALPRVAKLRKVLSSEPEGSIEGLLIEDKEYAIALHYRLVTDQQQVAQIERWAERLAIGFGFTLLEGKMMRELRPFGAGGKDRGIASIVRQVENFTGQRAKRVTYFGDDITDIDAFRYLDELNNSGEVTGVSIAVAGGKDQDVKVREAADFVVEGPAAVSGILASLAG